MHNLQTLIYIQHQSSEYNIRPCTCHRIHKLSYIFQNYQRISENDKVFKNVIEYVPQKIHWSVTLMERLQPQTGLYASFFIHNRFFPRIEFLDCLLSQYFSNVPSWWKKFLNFGLQIAGKCISDTLFDFKAHVVHCW